MRNPFRRNQPARRQSSRPNPVVSRPSGTPIEPVASALSLNTQGHIAYGIGGGLAVDTVDGSLGVNVGGFTVDTPSYDSGSSYCAPSSDSGSSYSSSSYDSGSSYSSSDSGSSYSSCD